MEFLMRFTSFWFVICIISVEKKKFAYIFYGKKRIFEKYGKIKISVYAGYQGVATIFNISYLSSIMFITCCGHKCFFEKDRNISMF